MRTLKIGFSKNKNDAIFSVLLQKWMKKEYSHCFIQYDVKRIFGDNAIYHSSLSSGIGYASKLVFEEANIIVAMYELEMSDEIYEQVRKELFKVCGRKYGMIQNIGIYFVDMLRKNGINVANPFTKDENCSEMVYRHALKVIDPTLDFDPNMITPKEIEEILKKIAKRIM